MSFISLQRVSKVYNQGSEQIHALVELTLEIEKGASVSIMGPSGSGKSTLLYIIGLMEKQTSGIYLYDEMDVSRLSDDEMSRLRNKSFGFIFQTFNLFPQLTVIENIEVPMIYGGIERALRREKAAELAALVGLSHRIKHRPTELSGGEIQRTCIARALSNNPAVLLADEPTGNLDRTTGYQIMETLCRLTEERGLTLIVVTHDPEVGRMTRTRIQLRDGRMTELTDSSRL